MPFSQIFPPSPSPTESIRLFYTSVSLLLSRTQGQCTILDAWGWCTGMTQRDGVGREEGGGFRMGSTCIPVADSFWCLAKLIQCFRFKKKKKQKTPNSEQGKKKKKNSIRVHFLWGLSSWTAICLLTVSSHGFFSVHMWSKRDHLLL